MITGGGAVRCAVVLALPAALLGAAGVTARAARATPIRHVVVLMQENHSFDSELGDWCKVTGRCNGIPARVTLSSGATVTPFADPDIVPNVRHLIADQAAAIDGGKMDGWQNVHGCAAPRYACVSYYRAPAIPNLARLAGAYGVEDRAFTQVDAPSWGGHLDEFAGTTDHFTGNSPGTGPGGWGCDSGKTASWVTSSGRMVEIPSCIPDYALGPDGGAFEPTPAAHVPTIMDEMDHAGVTWKIYTPLPGQGGYIWAGCPSFADCLDTSQVKREVSDNQFFTNAAAGKLPAVSFIEPHTQYSQHNGQSNAAGDNWIGKIASAVMNGPDWSSTALIITYDDCGCFYDQVAPPRAPDGRQEGTRVPFVVVSAHAKPRFTDSSPTTSTGSILAFIEATFGLPALNVNDRQAYNLAGMFNFRQTPLKRIHMVWQHLPRSAYRVNPQAARDGT